MAKFELLLSLARRRVAASVTSVALVLAGTLAVIDVGTAPSAAASTTISIDNASTNVLTSDYLGPSAWLFGFNYMPEDTGAGLTDSIDQLDYARLAAAGVHLLGTWYGEDWAMPTFGGSYDWTSTRMEAFYQWLRAMQSDNIDVALNMGWWFTDDTCQVDTAPSSNGGSDCTPTLSSPDDVAIYAHWVSDSINQLVNVMGFTNIKYIYMFREPNDSGVGNIPAGYTSLTFYKYVVDAVQAQMLTDGTRDLVNIVGPDIASLSDDDTTAKVEAGTSWLNYAAENLDTDGSDNSELDVYAGHDYAAQDCSAWQSEVSTAKALVPSGKPFWMDEGNISSYSLSNIESATTAFDTAEMYAGDIDGGAQTSMLWEYEDPQFVPPLATYTNGVDFTDGRQQWGLEPFPGASTSPRPAWYVWATMARFLGGPGTEVYGAPSESDGICTVATLLPDGSTTVMLVNTNSSASSVTVDLADPVQTLYRHQFAEGGTLPDNGEVIPTSEVLSNVGTTFSESLPASSVSIFTTEDDGSRPSPTPNYSGDLTDLALASEGATVTASSSGEWDGWRLAGVNDGILGPLGWASNDDTSSPHSEWLDVDLGSSKAFDTVTLYPVSGGAGDGAGFPEGITIQTSADDENWTTVVSETDYPQPTTAAPQYFTFPTQNAQYVKVTGDLTSPTTADDLYRFQLAELAVNLNPVAADDLALGATPTASSSYPGTGWSVDEVNDGDTGQVGWSSNSNLSEPHSEDVELNLGSSEPFDAVTLYPTYDGSQGVPSSISIETSPDGDTWTTVATSSSLSTMAGGLPEQFTFGEQNAQYVEVVGDITSEDTPDNLYRFELSEMAVTNTLTADNDFAIGATASASSSYEGSGWGLSEVNDGLLGPQGWASNDSTSSAHTEYVELQLSSTETIDNVTLYPAAYQPAGLVQGFPQDITIDTSTDGTSWTAVDSITDYPAPLTVIPQAFSFSATSAKYVKIVGDITAPNTADDLYRMMLAEVAIGDQ